MSLYEAIRDNNVKKVKSIIRKNRHLVNTSRRYGSPLLISAEGGLTDIIKVLLKHGADLNDTDSNGWTPLISACHFNHYNSALVLLEHNANPNVQCQLGNTALHAAALNDNVKMMQSLVEHGAQIDAVNADGWTPLHRATYSNRTNAIKYLLEQGADTTKKSNTGKTPYETALQMRLYDLAHLLRKHQGRQPVQEENEIPDSNNNSITPSSENNLQTRLTELKAFAMRLFNPIKDNNNKQETSTKGGTSTASYRRSDVDDDSSEDEGNKDECPICFEIPLPPMHIYQCTNGHIYCGKCKQKPNMNKCPQCGIDISTMENRNRYAEDHIAEVYKDKSATK